jgi:hypothetical protein
VQVVDFGQLAEITLRVQGHSFSDSTIITLDVWVDLRFRDGRKQKWRSSVFANDYRTIQAFLRPTGRTRRFAASADPAAEESDD